MRTSIVYCTYNRRRYLERSLAELVPQLDDSPDAEVIVVDDGSTDTTPQLAQSYAGHPRVQFIHQANLGASAARNAGAAAARGSWVTFLDDDAWPPHGWLQKLADVTARAAPEVVAIGGPVLLAWQQPKPDWLTERLLLFLTHFELPGGILHSATDCLFVGANMTVRREPLLSTGGFPTRLGRRAGNLLSREDNAVWERLRRQGIGIYDPSLFVWHVVQTERLRKKWFLQRQFWEGASWEVAATPEHFSASFARRVVRGLRRAAHIFHQGGPAGRFLATQSSPARFDALCAAAFELGRAWAIFRGPARANG